MISFDIDYIFLNLFLLIIFCFAGKKISKGGEFWNISVLCIFFFTLIEGLRYGRGRDYLTYFNRFKGGCDHFGRTSIFDSFNHLLKVVGIDEYSCFLVYAFFFVLFALFFIKFLGDKYAEYSFPLFILGYLRFNEWVIRQAFSYSFCFLFFVFLFKISSLKEIIRSKGSFLFMFILGYIAYIIHSANFVVIFFVTFFFFFIEKPFNSYITIPLYIISVYFISSSFDFSLFEPIFSFLQDKDELASQYIENSDKWFSEEGKNDIYTRNGFIQILEVVGISCYLYLAPKVAYFVGFKERVYVTFFNVSVVGLIVVATFRNLEILNRIGYILSLFLYFVLSLILYYKKSVLEINSDKYFVNTLAYCGLCWFVYNYIKFLFFPDEYVLFWWDVKM